jgi:cytoskeletal protein CcmA (bactofilin family)
MWSRESQKPSNRPEAPVSVAVAPAHVEPQPVAVVHPAPPPAPIAPAPPAKAKGATLAIKGEMTGAEDHVLEGRFEGKISLPEHVLTIGLGAQISAEIVARVVVVHGTVTGNVIANERMEIRASGRMDGDLVSPRVMMADGATFCGHLETRTPGKGGTKSKQPELVAV